MPYPTKALDEYALRRKILHGIGIPQPASPQNLRATSGNQQVVLTWDSATNATSYSIEQATSSGGPWTQITTTTLLTTTVTGLTNGTTYWFRVAGVAGSFTGSFSAAVSATPSAPAAVPARPAVSALTPGDKSLTFTLSPSTDATTYRVFINTSASFTTHELTITATTQGQASGYTVTITTIGGSPLTNGTTYYVMVRAVNAIGVSADSSPVQSGAPTATATTFASVVTSVGYKHWWRLNETSGTNFDDEAASELDATLSGTATVNQATLLADGDAANKSVAFTDGTATTASSADFTKNGNAVFSYWVTYKRTGTNDGAYHAIIEAPNVALFYNDTTFFLSRYDGTHEDNATTSPPTVGAIEHVLCRYNGSTLSLVRNGVEVATLASTFVSSNADAPLRFGQGQGAADQFVGQIDEVVFFDTYVSDADSLRLYQAASGTTGGGGGGGETPPASDLHEVLTNPPTEKSAGDLTALRAAILATPSGSTYVVPDGIYRIGSNSPIHIPAGVTVRNANKRAWFFMSRQWATGGEAGNTWSGPTSGYYTSSRAVPAIGTDENQALYWDEAKALRYEMCVGITSAGAITRFTSIAAGGTPTSGQFCFTSSGTRTIRLGNNPAGFARIEVVEAAAIDAHWFWPDGAGVTLQGLVFRYAPSGHSSDPAGSHGQNNFTMRNCVIGDTHGTACNSGESNNLLIEDCLIEYAGGSGITSAAVSGFTLQRCHILSCGYGGWDSGWQGGGSKFVLTDNMQCLDNVVRDCYGSGLWWDIDCRGPISVQGNLVANCYGPLFHFEVSFGPCYVGTVRGNCFAYMQDLTGWPVVYVSSSAGPGEIANNLIIAGTGQRAMQLYYELIRPDRHTVSDWYWHNNRYIIESAEPAIYIAGGAQDAVHNNRGSNESYYFGSNPLRWYAGAEYTSIAAWNATAFDENGVIVSAATATAWRTAWGV